jgi:alginate O-acetyltransferase complex protein AlgI
MPLAAQIRRQSMMRPASLAAVAATPLVVAPAWILVSASDWPDWRRMIAVAVAVFLAAKWLTFVDHAWGATGRRPPSPSVARVLGYFFLWPGMDAGEFLVDRVHIPRPAAAEWLAATAKLLAGVGWVLAAARYAATEPFLAGWVGIAGLLLSLHFGAFHFLSIVWRTAGVSAQPIMKAPPVAASLADFWSRRWNLAFRDLSHRFVFRPLSGRFGAAAATAIVFILSGLVHDAVVSIPVRAGFGLPTLYFSMQGLAMLLERSAFGGRCGLGRGLAGRFFAWIVVLVPLPLLFHRPFVTQAIAPLLTAIDSNLF